MVRLLVLGRTVVKPLPRRRKLPELVPNHVLRHMDRDVVLAVMDLKPAANEIREDGT